MWLLSSTSMDLIAATYLKKKNAQFPKKVATCLFKLLTNTHLIFSYVF